MTFKPAIWQPIAIILSAGNLVAVGFAAGAAEGWHAGVHAVLALAFGLWAQRMRRAPVGNDAPLEVIEALETEVGRLRDDVSELQERLDFTERLVVQGSESRRLPER